MGSRSPNRRRFGSISLSGAGEATASRASMTLSRAIEMTWLAVGAILLFDGIMVSRPDGMFSSRTSFAFAAFCLLYWVILRLSSGLVYRIMMIMGVAVLVGYPIRGLILTLDPDRFASTLWRPLFSDSDVLKAIIFVTMGTLAAWAGAWLAVRTRRNSSHQSFAARDGDFLLAHRRPLLTAAAVFSVINAALPTFNLLARNQSQSTEFSVLSQVLPLQVLTFVIVSLIINHWRQLVLPEKIAAVASALLTLTADLVGGRRGSLFGMLITYVIVSLWTQPNRKISVSRWAAATVLFIVVLPTLFGLTLSFRRSVDTGGTVQDVIVGGYAGDTTSVWSIAEFITDRLGNFDATLTAMNFNPPGLDEELSGRGMLRSFLLRLTPDTLYSPDQHTLGRLWGIYYQGIPETYRHAGAWSGFGIAFGFFRWWGALAVFFWVFAVARLLARFASVPALSGAVAAYLSSALLVVIVRSGNIDDVAAQAVAQLTTLGLLLALVRVPRRSPQASPPLPEAVRG